MKIVNIKKGNQQKKSFFPMKTDVYKHNHYTYIKTPGKSKPGDLIGFLIK